MRLTGPRTTRASENDELTDRVQGHGDDENLAHILPAFAQEVFSMIQIHQNRPEIGAPTRTRVSQSGMDREDYWLEDQSKRQWSV